MTKMQYEHIMVINLNNFLLKQSFEAAPTPICT